MTVYVDGIVDYGSAVSQRLGRPKWCHMTADTQEELHAAADAIGLLRSWFQNKDGVTWHYDITPGRRIQAVRNGAKEIGPHEMGALISKRRRELRDGQEKNG